MGYWSNLWDALLGRKPAVVIPVHTRVVPATESEKLPSELVAETAPITKARKVEWPQALRDKTSIEWSLDSFKNLSQKERLLVKQTIETLSNQTKDVATICDLNSKQARYVIEAFTIDKKWSSVVELSQYVSNEDVQMCYFLYLQCNDIKAVAMLFGLEESVLKAYFDKMEDVDKRRASTFTQFPPHSQKVRFNFFIKNLNPQELKNMLRIFRKAKRVTALRYILPMYSHVVSGQFSQKVFLMWSYAAKEESRRENDKS